MVKLCLHSWKVLEVYSSSITDKDGETFYGDPHTVEFVCHKCGKTKKKELAP